MKYKYESLMMCSEEEFESWVDLEAGMWFDWLNGEWKPVPKKWLKISLDEIRMGIITKQLK